MRKRLIKLASLAAVLLLMLLLLPIQDVLASAKYEYYTTGADDVRDSNLTDIRAQTFTPQTTHTIKSLVFNSCQNQGTLGTISIYLCDANHRPTGAALAVGTIDLTTVNAGTTLGQCGVITVTLSTTALLTALTEYVIVPTCTGTGSYSWYFALDLTSPTYANGGLIYSNDAGATWDYTSYYSGAGARDFYFEEWGDPIASGWTGTIDTIADPVSVDGVAVSGITSIDGIVP